jgi:hypothetical protein
LLRLPVFLEEDKGPDHDNCCGSGPIRFDAYDLNGFGVRCFARTQRREEVLCCITLRSRTDARITIVTGMLAHSRGGSGERRQVDLNALVNEALNPAYHGARARGQDFDIVLERDFDSTGPPD